LSASATGNPGEWQFVVAASDHHKCIVSYDVLVKNGSTAAIPKTNLKVVETMGASGGGLTLTFTDMAGFNFLTAGDRFILSGTDDVSTYKLQIHFDIFLIDEETVP
jgi:hypothetical protein